MDLQKLETILTEKSGNRFCCICGTPYKPYKSNQKTCGAPECQKALHAEYMKERAKRLKEKDIEAWRKYHRKAQAKSRAKKKGLADRDKELRELQDHWTKQAEFDAMEKDNYAERQKQKTLEMIPKIDVTLGGKNNDDVHTESNTGRS